MLYPMLRANVRLICALAVYCGVEAMAQPPISRLNPAVKQVVDQVSEERISAIMKRCV